MSDTAQVGLAVVCYAVAVSAQLAGLALLVTEARRTGAALRRWRDEDPERRWSDEDPEPAGQHGDLDRVVARLVGNSFDRTAAVVLLAVGVVAGALGHFLSL
ncbi:hypothetical protein [Geodermatophilus ruber]|uniref:Uncharacterized protein n=1 Tax=Geodermatophilus ruber TaxID=504800 RepID=A0A1I4G3N4_9ACTN|nr:hypothetical protein [Geodermatophilus ruber]SFL24379.1 hypothetical protein SAMN04488085_108127 [Geodermatophilus ruber]